MRVIFVLAICAVAYVSVVANDPTGPVKIKGINNLCLDVTNGENANKTPVQLIRCNGTPAQDWTLRDDGKILALGRCLTVNEEATSVDKPVHLFICNGGSNQKWSVSLSGEILNGEKCLDVEMQTPTFGRIETSTCVNDKKQKWIIEG